MLLNGQYLLETGIKAIYHNSYEHDHVIIGSISKSCKIGVENGWSLPSDDVSNIIYKTKKAMDYNLWGVYQWWGQEGGGLLWTCTQTNVLHNQGLGVVHKLDKVRPH